MYREIKEEYEKSIKDEMRFEEKKNIQKAFLQRCQKCMLDARDIRCLLENSIVESLTYDKTGAYITLNEEFGNMRLYVHETDFDGAPMDTLRDKEYLEKLWEQSDAPWKVWE